MNELMGALSRHFPEYMDADTSAVFLLRLPPSLSFLWITFSFTIGRHHHFAIMSSAEGFGLCRANFHLSKLNRASYTYVA